MGGRSHRREATKCFAEGVFDRLRNIEVSLFMILAGQKPHSGETLRDVDGNQDRPVCIEGDTFRATPEPAVQISGAITCSYSNGGALIAGGIGATLCETDGSQDCSAHTGGQVAGQGSHNIGSG